MTLQTWGQFGYSGLIRTYEKLHPNITINAQTVASSQAAETAINTHLAAGNGIDDVVAVEGGFLAAETQYPTKWLPVSKSLTNRWVTWKSALATHKTGRLRFYGVDAAPTAI
ncbi:extracellular solute-binding protein [Rathayibacter soli]|uniref:extracellular solute-binding protein n=1 Tax=Rathayibacter soli TaxID=3144168 RepID=UPI0027E41AA5|nr:extracellular solute-binding protein [Glaciibacter superstes]